MLKEEEAYHACRLIDGCLLKEKHAGMCIFPFIERGRRPSATQEEEIVPKPRKRKAALSFATPHKEATAPDANPKLPVAVEEEGRLEECDGCGRRFSTGGALGKHTWARMQNGGTCPVPPPPAAMHPPATGHAVSHETPRVEVASARRFAPATGVSLPATRLVLRRWAPCAPIPVGVWTR